jgi:HD-GYP domain-containing protein (c-di-GMP phosphodiesterase class II)
MHAPRARVIRAAALVVAVLPALALVAVGDHTVMVDGWVHFAGVGLAAAIATAAAVALTIAGALAADGRAVLAGLAFSVMAALLCLHGAATPGFLVGMNGVVAFTGAATLPVGAAILALGTLPALRRPQVVRPLVVALVVASVVIVALGVSAILEPALVPAVPETRSLPAWIVLAIGLVACGLLVWRAYRTYRLTHRLPDLLVVVGIAWLGTALAASLLFGPWDLGWWLGHAVEIAGIGLVGIPVALDLRRGARHQSRPLVGDLRAVDLVTSEEAFLGSQVRSLLVALAAKDGSTEEHTRRVALRAVEVGEELGLPPGRLRALAVGGLLHDIGKLAVDDAVLKKPGPLTETEFASVKAHPESGIALLAELGGFDEVVHGLVLDHHERLDGGGYPRRLVGDEITLEARILGVCDVYDALISPRVYRGPWAPERALAHLRDGAGSAFDPRCVEALARVLERERRASAVVTPPPRRRQAAARAAFLSPR